VKDGLIQYFHYVHSGMEHTSKIRLILLSLTSYFVILLKCFATIHQVNIFTIHCVRF